MLEKLPSVAGTATQNTNYSQTNHPTQLRSKKPRSMYSSGSGSASTNKMPNIVVSTTYVVGKINNDESHDDMTRYRRDKRFSLPTTPQSGARFTIGRDESTTKTSRTNNVRAHTSSRNNDVNNPHQHNSKEKSNNDAKKYSHKEKRRQTLLPEITLKTPTISTPMLRCSSSGNIGETVSKSLPLPSRRKNRHNHDSKKLSLSLGHIDTRSPAEDIKRHVIHDRIKEFIVKDNPGRPPLSLRYVAPKVAGEGTKLVLRPKTPQLPINTSSCPNLYLLADREKWSYNNYRPGKCRYLRCPQSPVLGPAEIFSDIKST